MSLGIFFIIFAVLIVVGMPIGVGIAMTAIVPSLVNSGFSANAQLVIRSMLSGIDSFPLLAVPMFIISGIVMARACRCRNRYNSLYTHFRRHCRSCNRCKELSLEHY